ncbi:MAG: hypothetical protein ABIN54_10190, partial [candidate division WOR-3 bacterium]
FLACAFLILVGMAIEPFVSTFIPSLTSYERRYSVFTKALLCLERSRGGYARLSCIRTCFWGVRVYVGSQREASLRIYHLKA